VRQREFHVNHRRQGDDRAYGVSLPSLHPANRARRLKTGMDHFKGGDQIDVIRAIYAGKRILPAKPPTIVPFASCPILHSKLDLSLRIMANALAVSFA
jgi:hypothetical protein